MADDPKIKAAEQRANLAKKVALKAERRFLEKKIAQEKVSMKKEKLELKQKRNELWKLQ